MERDGSILIVSADPALLPALRSFLPSLTFRWVDSAESAVESFEKERFDLVCCEAHIPGATGIQMCERCLALHSPPGFLLICSQQDWPQALDVMRRGALDCLVKPLSEARWREQIEHSLARRRTQQQQDSLRLLLHQALEDRTLHLQQALDEIELTRRYALEALALALDAREPFAQWHSQRVRAYTLHLAARCGYGRAPLRELSYAALLHDIGKVVVPDSILHKPGPLTEQEQLVIRQHPLRGYQILSRIPHLQQAALLALCHHERVDGTGYPRGLAGTQIPLEARIFAVADALDVILTDRPYRQARSLPEARLEILRCAGTQFDSDVVEIFLAVSDDEWDQLRASATHPLLASERPTPEPI